MRRVLMVMFVACWALPAPAQNPAASCECNPKAGTLVIRYTNDYAKDNPPWPKGLQRVEFFSLLVLNKDQTTVEDTRSKRVLCNLKSERFEVLLEPGVPNVNLLGRCGADVTGVVTVKRNGTVVINEQEFEDLNCHERKRMLDRITFRVGKTKPELHDAGYPE
jgi:hypothetical protein